MEIYVYSKSNVTDTTFFTIVVLVFILTHITYLSTNNNLPPQNFENFVPLDKIPVH